MAISDHQPDDTVWDFSRSVSGGISPTTARQQLADRILTAIAIGAFSPGDQLPSERDLAEWQGVSRVTVRGAIEIVRQQGLLSSKRGRAGGTFVTEINVDQVAPGTTKRILADEIPRLREFVDFRCLVAALEARTAAERRSTEQAAALSKILDDFMAADDVVIARRVDVDLHNQITRMAGNAQLAALTAELSARATMGFHAEPYPASYLERARQDHTDIVESIVNQDLERAYHAAFSHFALTLTIMEEALAKSG